MFKKSSFAALTAVIVIFAVCISVSAVGNIAFSQDPENGRTAAGTIVEQMPVANVDRSPALTYKHNESIWTASGNQYLEESYVTGLVSGSNYHVSERYSFTLKPFTGSNGVWLLTPFTNSYIKDGIRPKVRVLYFEMRMPVGVNATLISVSSGETGFARVINWAGTGAVKDYTFDMGSYYNMNRGINIALYIQNDQASNQAVATYGGGAKLEW